ncbi:hypothetical protein QBC35DRAFT_96837 [Podospora australis]|uniref:Uncharacterized protein n=1 Tax=Podospora australis TaxID=1536484 RepID=A0AAN7ACH9_9PEZI|nr:hypothetical protein QBC35DRAFT_96837 [Podospora australis]
MHNRGTDPWDPNCSSSGFSLAAVSLYRGDTRTTRNVPQRAISRRKLLQAVPVRVSGVCAGEGTKEGRSREGDGSTESNMGWKSLNATASERQSMGAAGSDCDSATFSISFLPLPVQFSPVLSCLSHLAQFFPPSHQDQQQKHQVETRIPFPNPQLSGTRAAEHAQSIPTRITTDREDVQSTNIHYTQYEGDLYEERGTWIGLRRVDDMR